MGSDQPPPSPQNQPPSPLTPQEALEMRVKAAQRTHDDERDFGMAANQAAVKNGEEVLKAALLINGGSSVAMLAFIGTLVSRDVISSAQLAEVTRPLLSFGAGVALSVFASAAAYFTNLHIAGSSGRRQREYLEPFIRDTPSSKRYASIAEVFRWFCIICALGSIGCFVWGLVTAKSAFNNIALKEPAAQSSGAK
jgi:hypothetical protein